MKKVQKRTTKVDKNTNALKSKYLIGAVPYAVYVTKWVDGVVPPRQPVKNGEYPKLTSGSDGTFRDFLLSFLKSREAIRKLEDTQAGMFIKKDSIVISGPNEICCVIWAGRYGIQEELHNVVNGQIKLRDFEDCASMPFNVRFIFNPGFDKMIMIVERYGSRSPATIIFDSLRQYIHDVFPESDQAILSSSLISNLEYVQQQFDQRVKALHFVTHKIPHDIADHIRIDGDTTCEHDCNVDIKVSAGRGRFLRAPRFLRKLTTASARGLTVGGEQYSDIKMELKVGNRTQTVIAGDDAFRIVYDITEKVVLNEMLHPTIESFVSATEACLRQSKRTLDWR